MSDPRTPILVGCGQITDFAGQEPALLAGM